MAVTSPSRTIHPSKSSIAVWESCPLRYRFDKIERRPGEQEEPGRAQLLGTAAHEAAAAAIVDPAGPAAAERVLGDYALDDNDLDAAQCWASDAARFAAARGGQPRWVEELLVMERIAGVAVWGKFDVAIQGGSAAPIEVIDWTFGRARVAGEEDLAASWAGRLYRLLAGTHEPDRRLRPIAITEVHVPTMAAVTMIPDDEYVRAAFQDVKDLAAEIRSAAATGEFPARTGSHCRFCPHRAACPAIASGSDAVPL